MSQIRVSRREISKWRKNNQSYGKDRITDLKRAFEEIQNDDNQRQEDLIEVTKKLREAYVDQKQYWKQKKQKHMVKRGDNNTKFFHAQTKQKGTRNQIIGLYNKAGRWVNLDGEKKEMAVSYFDELFTSTSPHWI